MGMDADLVEQSGRQLKSQASQLGSLVTQLDRLVNGLPSVWDGPDAQRFVHQWWPEHRKMLTAAQQQIDGLGQSALNNASEQRQVSSGGGAGAALAGAAVAAGGATAAVKANSNGHAGGNGAAVDKFVSKWGNQKIDYDGAFGAQCFDVFRQYNHDVTGAPDSTAHTSIKASAIYTDFDHNGLSPYYDRIAASQGSPQPGDVIVYGSNDPSGYGHVAVVTEVGTNGQYKALEQNYSWWDGVDANDPATVRPHTLGEKGTGVTVLGYLRPKDAKV
jgi:uncharacterized protein YukE